MEFLFVLIIIQGLMGAFDTLYHHEMREMLPWDPNAAEELKIHAIRNLFYCFLFLSLALGQWQGLLVYLFVGVLIIEILLTLWDFVVEDQTRLLVPSERVLHTVLAINYGFILALLSPILLVWLNKPTQFVFNFHGLYSVILLFFAAAVFLWAIRDGLSSIRLYSVRNNLNRLGNNLMQLSTQNQKILLTGGSGFIGRKLCQKLISDGHSVTILTRHFKSTAELFDGKVTLISNFDQLSNDSHFDAMINLAGEPIAGTRWSKKAKASFVNSRVSITQAIEKLIKRLETKPTVLINGSAIGFYGLRGDEKITEEDQGQDCFSHQLCKQWEDAAVKISNYGVRVCLLRTGMVLGKQGGPLEKLLFPFQFGLGGKMASGKQWMSWIHLEDLVNMILFSINNDKINGAINGVSPNPVANLTFTKTLATQLNRPAFFTVPGFMLKLLIGEMAEELIINGQRVIPNKAINNGFSFKYSTLNEALAAIID